MSKIQKHKNRLNAEYVTGVVFLMTFAFFQFAYPYHLIRREQQNLFLFDFDYIRQTYTGNGWLYHEAALIWLSQKDLLSQESAMELGISESDVNRMNSFGRNPEAYRNTYWYYYLTALNRIDR